MRIAERPANAVPGEPHLIEDVDIANEVGPRRKRTGSTPLKKPPNPTKLRCSRGPRADFWRSWH
jgi:hypothetical protein